MKPNIHNAVVLGTGMMGPGIAATLCAGGIATVLVSRTAESAEAGLAKTKACLETLSREGLLRGVPLDECVALLSVSTDQDAAVRDCGLVIESTPENLEHKQALFAHLDEVAPANAILATNTSALSITAIALRCRRPERVVTAHFWNPPHLIPLVEIVRGKETAQGVIDELRALLEHCGKAPVVVQKDRPGQLGNRLQVAMVREALYIIQEGIATAEDIDRALKNGIALRLPAYGLLEHQDMVGLDLVQAVHAVTTHDLCHEPDPLPLLQEKVARGELGAKSGQGLYDWSQRDAAELRRRRDECVLYLLKLAGRTGERE